MADIHDVINCDQEVEDQLHLLDEEKDLNRNICIGITAICRAITALGVRIDYVIRDINKGHDWPSGKRY